MSPTRGTADASCLDGTHGSRGRGRTSSFGGGSVMIAMKRIHGWEGSRQSLSRQISTCLDMS